MDLIADRPEGDALGAAAMTYKVGRDLSQPSHRLTGRHRTRADSLDIRRILTSDPDSGALAGRMALVYGSDADEG
jgi:hypothetical protein